ncbi:8-oxo-dGTP diphosphatase [Glycomyces buryatensis]|uniref:Oxidized purine nucleoside triphosphate hydrolase n=1 Tax=Glycomyces buryatensis TaxID=2570927 RepID=A0A4S8QJH2_9ACTN|nr:8-oxo-dGTP diphosphatase [Glycomyces buryatensis]THV43412.1 8-oxo-dGTP diphosphatase [Glycomyces buryatensis]
MNGETTPASRVCLGLLLRETAGSREVLLGRKQYGFGVGKLVAPGGHIEPGETPEQATAREIAEEVGLVVSPSALAPVATVSFLFPAKPAWTQVAEVFRADEWSGEAIPSDELVPVWVPTDALPFDQMWDDATYWLPKVLAGERFDVTFTFADDNAHVIEARFSPR